VPSDAELLEQASAAGDGAINWAFPGYRRALHSDTYVQCARFLRRPELAAPAEAALASQIRAAACNRIPWSVRPEWGAS
jgi:orotate phosphoribosyltransferase